ncbi:MAG: sulfurtransferase-like selenium metabolism protein YedF [Eubacteriales bacterium]|nr:sulfurtransferase-like selenium metabolism protein YedF [Eubacteriales bacterium]
MSKRNVVDSLGDKCPVPVVKAKKALDQAAPGDVVEVHVDNEIAVQNLMKLAGSMQCGCSRTQVGEKHFVVEITAGERDGEPEEDSPETVFSCAPVPENTTDPGYVVVVSSDLMGTGEEALGKILLKGFLYAVSQLDSLPKAIVFYNRGIMVTTEGSESVEDLKAMEARGVEIYSCGTCLDYYGRKELLKVGQVTNMYTIAELMTAAGRVVKP